MSWPDPPLEPETGPMPATSAPFLLGGRYRLENWVGSGGFGEVWRGTDTVLARPVAVKLLRAEFAEDMAALRRFRDEARHAGSLAHENIVRIYDYEAPSSAHPAFLVMEFVGGPSLAEVLAGGPMDPRKVMDLVAQAASGLDTAHGSGLVHCDVKPGNILFAPDGTVKLTDFGLSRAAGSAPLTASGALVGTPAYLAPERVTGQRGTAAGDLYALGVVAYECLAGELPFQGPPLQVALAQQSRSMPPLPAGVPAEVAELVSQLTAKDPVGRPGSAGEVASRAQALRDGMIPREQTALAGHGAARAARTPAAPAAPATSQLNVTPQPWRSPGRRWPGRGMVLSAAAVVALLAALLLIGVFHPGPHRPASAARATTMVEVNGRSLSGRLVDAVRGYLRHLGLAVRVRWRPSDRVAAGRVLSVHPTGRVASGSTIVVVGARRPAGPAMSAPPSGSAGPPLRQAHRSGGAHRRAGGPTPAGSPAPSGSSSPTGGPSPTGSATPTVGPTPTAGPSPEPSSTPPA